MKIKKINSKYIKLINKNNFKFLVKSLKFINFKLDFKI